MVEENEELKKSIQQFYELLDNHPDDLNSVHEFATYLRSLLRIESTQPLPKMEVMTLIKHHKPTIFWGLKKMASNNVMLGILTHLYTDLDSATENLNRILK